MVQVEKRRYFILNTTLALVLAGMVFIVGKRPLPARRLTTAPPIFQRRSATTGQEQHP